MSGTVKIEFRVVADGKMVFSDYVTLTDSWPPALPLYRQAIRLVSALLWGEHPSVIAAQDALTNLVDSPDWDMEEAKKLVKLLSLNTEPEVST